MPSIFIASDFSSAPRSAVELAARLAASQRLDLEFVLLRDEGLSRIAGLPEQRLVLHTGSFAALSPSSLERSWRALGSRTRAAALEVARRAGVGIDFRATDGVLDAHVADIASEPRCIVVAPPRPSRVGRTDTVHLDVRASWSAAPAMQLARLLTTNLTLSANSAEMAARARVEAGRLGVTVAASQGNPHSTRIIATSPGGVSASELRRWRRSCRAPLVIVTRGENP